MSIQFGTGGWRAIIGDGFTKAAGGELPRSCQPKSRMRSEGSFGSRSGPAGPAREFLNVVIPFAPLDQDPPGASRPPFTREAGEAPGGSRFLAFLEFAYAVVPFARSGGGACRRTQSAPCSTTST